MLAWANGVCMLSEMDSVGEYLINKFLVIQTYNESSRCSYNNAKKCDPVVWPDPHLYTWDGELVAWKSRHLDLSTISIQLSLIVPM